MLIAWSQGQGSGAAVAVTTGVPLEQRIFDAVAARFHTITTANGYLTNIGSNVFEWKPEAWDLAQDSPGVDLRDSRSDDTLAIGQEIHKLRISARCVTNGASSSDDVRKIKADVITMVNTDPNWTVDGTALAQDTGQVTAQLAQIEQGESRFMGVDVVFEIEYVTEIGNAYS